MNQTPDEQMAAETETDDFRRWGTRQIEITDVRLLDAAGQDTTVFRTGDALTVEMAYVAHEPITEPEFGLALYRHDGLHINGPNTRAAGLGLGVIEGPGVARYHIESLPFLPGRYQITAAVHDSDRPVAYDYHEEAYSFRIIEGGTDEKEGLLALDAAWEWYSLPVDESVVIAYPPAEPVP